MQASATSMASMASTAMAVLLSQQNLILAELFVLASLCYRVQDRE